MKESIKKDILQEYGQRYLSTFKLKRKRREKILKQNKVVFPVIHVPNLNQYSNSLRLAAETYSQTLAHTNTKNCSTKFFIFGIYEYVKQIMEYKFFYYNNIFLYRRKVTLENAE